MGPKKFAWEVLVSALLGLAVTFGWCATSYASLWGNWSPLWVAAW